MKYVPKIFEIRNYEVWKAWWNQSHAHARNHSRNLEFSGNRLFRGEDTIAILHQVGKKKIALVTRDKLTWNSKTQRYNLINYWFAEHKLCKYCIVNNMDPQIKEHHLDNVVRMEKDIRRVYHRLSKIPQTRFYIYKLDDYKKSINNFLDYVKIFKLKEINTEWISVQKMVLKLTQ